MQPLKGSPDSHTSSVISIIEKKIESMAYSCWNKKWTHSNTQKQITFLIIRWECQLHEQRITYLGRGFLSALHLGSHRPIIFQRAHTDSTPLMSQQCSEFVPFHRQNTVSTEMLNFSIPTARTVKYKAVCIQCPGFFLFCFILFFSFPSIFVITAMNTLAHMLVVVLTFLVAVPTHTWQRCTGNCMLCAGKIKFSLEGSPCSLALGLSSTPKVQLCLH